MNVSMTDYAATLERRLAAAAIADAKAEAMMGAMQTALAKAHDRIAELEAKLPPEPIGPTE